VGFLAHAALHLILARKIVKWPTELFAANQKNRLTVAFNLIQSSAMKAKEYKAFKLKPSTKIMSAGLVDEGIEYERMEKEIEELKAKLGSGKLICPMCKEEMAPFNYKGYYDDFSGWKCACEYMDEAKVTYGMYA